MINPSTTYAGVQGPSASAYVTYCINNDALRAIQSVNNITIDGRLIKTSLGTTKYCSHFMKNQQCPKPDCMYLHELGDLQASFTKEEMYQGKHQEYEKRLHDALIAQTAAGNNTSSSSPNGKPGKNNKQLTENSTQNGPEKNKEAWPSLSTSPVNKDTIKTNKNGNNKENGVKKIKSEKIKNKKSTTPPSSTNGTSNGHTSNGHNGYNKENNANNSTSSNSSNNSGKDAGFNITNDGMSGEAMETPNPQMSADEELNLLSEIENDALSADGKADTPSLR